MTKEAMRVHATEPTAVHPLVPAKRVGGSKVYDPSGEQVGRIRDVALDKESGKVAYVILATGGFMGIGETYRSVPWSKLAYDTLVGGYIASTDAEEIRCAPELDVSKLSGWDRTPWHDPAYIYSFGVRPY